MWNRGHRQRLRQRFERSSENSLQDYELLELLLTFAIPRVDTKVLAKGLLGRFGSLSDVFAASAEQVMETSGIGPRAALLLSLVPCLAARSMVSSRINRVILRSPQEASDYFLAKLCHLREEQVHAAFLNARNAVVAVECLQTGTVDHSVVYPRHIIERVLVHKASGFILAHNHPSGDTTPSKQDLSLTENLLVAAQSMGIHFHDHLIIGEGSPCSLRQLGLLP